MSPKSKKNKAPVTPATPPAPVPTVDANGKPLYVKLLELARSNRAELFTHAKEAVRFDAAVEKAQLAFNGCKKFAGKVMAAMQVAYVTALNERSITPDTKFEAYHEANTGSSPNARIQALGRLFNRLVEMGHITESVYDEQTVDALEAANAALSAIEKKYKGTGTDPKTTPEFLAVVNALKGLDATGRPLIGTDSTKAIKALKKGMKEDGQAGESKEEPFTLVTSITPEIALQLIGKIFAAGQQVVCFAHVPDLFAGLTPEAQRDTFCALDTMQKRIWAQVGEQAKAWAAAQDAKSAPVQLLHAGQPAEIAA